jgi:transcriptional regulator with XRE-family HTH domain
MANINSDTERNRAEQAVQKEIWQAIGHLIFDRMDQLGITQTRLVIRSGLSKAAVGELVHGKARRRSPRTLAAISKALEWHPDYLECILAGRTPPEAPTFDQMPGASDWEEILGILRDMNRSLVEVHKRIQDCLTLGCQSSRCDLNGGHGAGTATG